MKPISHTQISNEFIDSHMHNLNGSEVKCFMAICRKTIGWHKETDYISISQMQKMTGLSNRAVIKAVKVLSDYGLITKEHSKSLNKYSINYDEKSQDVVKQSDEKSQGRVTKSHNQSDEKSYTKETNLKKPIKRNSIVVEKQQRFIVPTVNDVTKYLFERKITSFGAEQFIDYYTSKGWMIGKNKMKDWKAAVRTWERNDKNKNPEHAVQIRTNDNGLSFRSN